MVIIKIIRIILKIIIILAGESVIRESPVQSSLYYDHNHHNPHPNHLNHYQNDHDHHNPHCDNHLNHYDPHKNHHNLDDFLGESVIGESIGQSPIL